MPDYYHWFQETEEGKKPEPDSPAAVPEKKPGGFVAQNPGSYSELIRERQHGKADKPTIKDPIFKALLELDKEES